MRCTSDTDRARELISIGTYGSARHARGGRVPGRAALVARGEPPGGDPGAPRWSGPLRRARDARVEPCAPRRGVRRADVAEGVRRRRSPVHPSGDLPRGDGARRGAAAHRRDRPGHGGADDHRPRHRGAEGALPRAAPLRRGDLVPGILGARRGLRPRRRPHELAARRRPLRRERPEGVVVVRPPRRLLHPAHAERPRLDEARRAQLPHRGHARARGGGSSAQADNGRGGVQRDLLHRCARPGGEPSRRGRKRLAGRDDDAPPRARHARLRAAGGARGADSQARRARARPRRRPAAARSDRTRVDRDAGGALHELPLALGAHEDRAARARRGRSPSSCGRSRTSA